MEDTADRKVFYLLYSLSGPIFQPPAKTDLALLLPFKLDDSPADALSVVVLLPPLPIFRPPRDPASAK
jgi:hypothetical protein